MKNAENRKKAGCPQRDSVFCSKNKTQGVGKEKRMNVRKPTDYSTMFAALDKLMTAQLSQMELYCEIGRTVSGRPEKGAAVAAADYLQKTYPDMSGFSPRNLRRMREFYRSIRMLQSNWSWRCGQAGGRPDSGRTCMVSAGFGTLRLVETRVDAADGCRRSLGSFYRRRRADVLY